MLKKIRESAGMSQSQLASVSGVTLRMIQQWEQGVKDINGTKLHNLVALAKALNCQISNLLTDENLKKELKEVTL